MKIFFSIVFYIGAVILFFFVAPHHVSSYMHSQDVMNIPTMFESLFCFVLGTMFAIMAYVDKKVESIKPVASTSNNVNEISQDNMNDSKASLSNESIDNTVNYVWLVISIIIILAIAISLIRNVIV